MLNPVSVTCTYNVKTTNANIQTICQKKQNIKALNYKTHCFFKKKQTIHTNCIIYL